MHSTVITTPTARTLALAAAIVAALGAPALASTEFLQRFDGSFRGSGTVQREQDSEPRRVSCSLTGQQGGPNTITLAGTCRAAVIVSREIGANIRYDPASDRFSGSYTGSSRGAAQLTQGRVSGDTLTFRLTYPTPVHGDRDATMTIRNAGDGSFTLTVTDQVDGAPRQTSNVTLTQG